VRNLPWVPGMDLFHFTHCLHLLPHFFFFGFVH
jgi:hypothetical protein